MTRDERRLGVLWPLVRTHLPAPPARVVELGCGPHGGFVPMLRAAGYEAVGIDPRAPAEAGYQRIEFEHAELPEPVDAVIACTSLHHVADPVDVVDRITASLASGGVLVVVEWSWERFDGPTAQWCFERLAPADPGWLGPRREEWVGSGQAWEEYFRDWAGQAGLHSAESLVRLLDRRFERQLLRHGPYFFADLADTSEADEQAAIDARRIQATRVDYIGKLR